MKALPDLNSTQSPAATLCVRSVAGEIYARRTSRLTIDFKTSVSASVGTARSVTMADMAIFVEFGSSVDSADEPNVYGEQGQLKRLVCPPLATKKN